jgi:hypothetical protein
VDDFNCIAFQVAKNNKIIKLSTFNDITSSAYNPTVDCHNNIAVRNSISFPIYDIHTSKVIAVVQMFNKKQIGKGFTEFDEIFGTIYCNCAAFILNACSKSTRTSEQANILTRILSASQEMLTVLKEKIDMTTYNHTHNNTTTTNNNNNTPMAIPTTEPLSSTDLLTTLELVIEKLLKCGKVKAFIPSIRMDMEPALSKPGFLEPGLLLFLEDKKSNRLAHGSYMKAMRSDAGLIGNALRTRSVCIVDGIETEALIHPDVSIMMMMMMMINIIITTIIITVHIKVKSTCDCGIYYIWFVFQVIISHNLLYII